MVFAGAALLRAANRETHGLSMNNLVRERGEDKIPEGEDGVEHAGPLVLEIWGEGGNTHDCTDHFTTECRKHRGGATMGIERSGEAITRRQQQIRGQIVHKDLR